MKHYKLKTGKGELNSTSGNHLCSLVLGNLPKATLPPNFQPRRSDAIADRDILLCAMVAFNLLRTLGQEVIKRKATAPQRINAKRWRLKTVLQNIIYCAVRLVRHGGTTELHHGKRCPWFDVIRDIASSYA
ncbi:hypothetical protein [Pontiella sulfatireligans]|uniref:Transposase DDE domain-containing protein n=1 Tax=Pontiella sulfatireligans TaxID=2750658 RepID=A0A6C2UDY9_9BACT|nr:hypothetical protein [Pontiella sulfatireligans]VGO18380.1 hypothetical protein SCARR_00432 [Pontiella sulfatireligans]